MYSCWNIHQYDVDGGRRLWLCIEERVSECLKWSIGGEAAQLVTGDGMNGFGWVTGDRFPSIWERLWKGPVPIPEKISGPLRRKIMRSAVRVPY